MLSEKKLEKIKKIFNEHEEFTVNIIDYQDDNYECFPICVETDLINIDFKEIEFFKNSLAAESLSIHINEKNCLSFVLELPKNIWS